MSIFAVGGGSPQYFHEFIDPQHTERNQNHSTQGTAAGLSRPQESNPGNKDRQYTEEQLAQIRELKARDQEVRQHEAAHQAAGGSLAGAANFTYERGPDGRMYAVGGEVSIDMSPVRGDPQATIDKMRTVHAAATAPANPSSQDHQVAAQAMIILVQAQQELLRNASSASTHETDSNPTLYARQQGIMAYKAQA